MSQEKIRNRIKSLKEIDNVDVVISDESGQIRITHGLHHVADFRFKWLGDHYAGYFVDAQGDESQAIVSLWTPLEAIRFVSLYATLVDLRAKREQS